MLSGLSAQRIAWPPIVAGRVLATMRPCRPLDAVRMAAQCVLLCDVRSAGGCEVAMGKVRDKVRRAEAIEWRWNIFTGGEGTFESY